MTRGKASRTLVESFGHAFAGLFSVWRLEANFLVHLAAAWLVLFLGRWLGLEPARMAVLILIATLVLATELVNTAVEVVVDLVTGEYHPLARLAKDIGAAAVLVASLGAVGAGATLIGGDFRLLFRAVQGRWVESPAEVTLVLTGVVVLLAAAAIVRRHGRRS